MREMIWGSMIQQLEEYGCTDLAGKIRKQQGIGRQFEPSGSLNGSRLPNRYRRVLYVLITGGLERAGTEQARRTVDIAFKSAGLTIVQGERDILAHLLVNGHLRRRWNRPPGGPGSCAG